MAPCAQTRLRRPSPHARPCSPLRRHGARSLPLATCELATSCAAAKLALRRAATVLAPCPLPRASSLPAVPPQSSLSLAPSWSLLPACRAAAKLAPAAPSSASCSMPCWIFELTDPT
uniref:Uncharacterized protein n=1 Tax=Arundo donax TaxID=35708 RepID=A0A0A9GRI6_ARUDO